MILKYSNNTGQILKIEFQIIMGIIKENRETTACFGTKVNEENSLILLITSEFQVFLVADQNADPMLPTSITSEIDSIGYCSIVSRAAHLLACFTSVKQ